jgi:hypothetical protein
MNLRGATGRASESGDVKEVDDACNLSGESAQRWDGWFAVDYSKVDFVNRYREGSLYLGLGCASGDFKQDGFIL